MEPLEIAQRAYQLDKEEMLEQLETKCSQLRNTAQEIERLADRMEKYEGPNPDHKIHMNELVMMSIAINVLENLMRNFDFRQLTSASVNFANSKCYLETLQSK